MVVILGRGAFTQVIEKPEDTNIAVKVIDVDLQRPPHDWRAEIAALSELSGKDYIIHMIRYTESRRSLDHVIRIEMPRYRMTLENVIFNYAKASYPPGSGWRNVMPASRIAQICRCLASGLHAIHSAGIIHRDIKSENVLFDSVDGDPILIDFGVAWVPSVSASAEPETKRITDVSTGEYKAPELLFGVNSYTNKIDIWALGCIVARLLGPDCKPLFTPYRSDIALIGSQFNALGTIDLSKCPTLDGTVARTMAGHLTQRSEGARLQLGRLGAQNKYLEELAHEMLEYEPTKRPTAQEIGKAVAPYC